MRTSMASTADALPLDQMFDALASIDVAMAIFDRDDRIVARSPSYAAMFPEEGLACGVYYRAPLRLSAERHDRVRILGYPYTESYLDAEVPRPLMPSYDDVYRQARGPWRVASTMPMPG